MNRVRLFLAIVWRRFDDRHDQRISVAAAWRVACTIHPSRSR